MKITAQLFNQLPGIPQDQVLTTPNVAEPDQMVNEAVTLPDEAQANLANVVQEQAMAWADILRKGRIAEEAKNKKRASNLYRPMLADYARGLDSGERQIDRKNAPGAVGTVPHVSDVDTDLQAWHEQAKKDIATQLNIHDDESLVASVNEELDSLFIEPRGKILGVIQKNYTLEAQRMASDYVAEVALESIGSPINKQKGDEKVASYLQSMVEAGIFQDNDTIVLMKEYETTVDNNQMNYDAALNPMAFVKSIEDGSFRDKYPNASINIVSAAYGRYKPVEVAETKKEEKLRKDTKADLAYANLDTMAANRPVTLIHEITGKIVNKNELLLQLQQGTQPTLTPERIEELKKLPQFKDIPQTKFGSSISRYLNEAYRILKSEASANLKAQQKGTKDQFNMNMNRLLEKLSVNEGWSESWTQAQGIGEGAGWWNSVAYDGLGLEKERQNLDSIWEWSKQKNELLQKVESRSISQPEMIKMLNELNPEKSIIEGESTDGIQWKRGEYTNLKAYLERAFLNPSDIGKKDQDLAGFAMQLTGSAETWSPNQPVPFEQIVGFESNWKNIKIPESAAEFYSAGFRVIPLPVKTMMKNALSQVNQSESAGDMEAFLGMFELYYPEEKHREIAIREFAADNPDFDSSYLLFTDPAIDKKGDPLPSAYVDETIQAAVAEASVLQNQIKDKYGDDGQTFINDLSGDDGEVGQAFYGDFGFGNSTAMRNSPTAIEPYRALHERMAMKLKLRKPDLSAEEAAEMAHHQLFDVRYKIYKNPEDENQVLFMPHSKFQRGYAGMAEPDDVTKAETMVIAGIAPSMLMSLGEVQGAFAKQKNEKLLELEVTGRDGAINRNVNNLLRKVADQFNIAEDAIRRNPNIEILPVPNENNSGRYYKLIHPDTQVWVWLQNKAGEKWEISTDQIADLTFQTHYRAFYYKMPEYLEGGKSWAQSAFEKFEEIKPDFLPSVDSEVGKKFFETDSPIEILQEIADSPAYFNDTPDLDVSVTEWPFDYRAFNVAPDSPWMIGGIERAHLKNEFLPALKERYGENPSREQILELADEFTGRFADLTGQFYFDHVWRFFGVDPLKPQNYILPEGMRPGSLPVSEEQEQQMEEEIQATVKPAS
tara:strand:+ start:14321 stop:17659 length:3339 start_codon:yes stop_codon:yes gene_type:complete